MPPIFARSNCKNLQHVVKFKENLPLLVYLLVFGALKLFAIIFFLYTFFHTFTVSNSVALALKTLVSFPFGFA